MPRPDFSLRWRTWTRESVSERSSAHSPVPSGEPSSTMRASTSGCCYKCPDWVTGRARCTLLLVLTTRRLEGTAPTIRAHPTDNESTPPPSDHAAVAVSYLMTGVPTPSHLSWNAQVESNGRQRPCKAALTWY